jgi:hypothetical protein
MRYGRRGGTRTVHCGLRMGFPDMPHLRRQSSCIYLLVCDIPEVPATQASSPPGLSKCPNCTFRFTLWILYTFPDLSHLLNYKHIQKLNPLKCYFSRGSLFSELHSLSSMLPSASPRAGLRWPTLRDRASVLEKEPKNSWPPRESVRNC